MGGRAGSVRSVGAGRQFGMSESPGRTAGADSSLHRLLWYKSRRRWPPLHGTGRGVW
ncbi:hypothetical protein BZL30_4647 [Mycobacterium kansasii]|uniref:Uncharacterized protein n=1 Tax=Mycobacterium kansasii TaxID=1768 RepID=A0A1V3X3I7_MYCKA|nr:hypothetical protein BZL30_4647 [Mycobacterium kansasii]